jgi:glycine oxidase
VSQCRPAFSDNQPKITVLTTDNQSTDNQSQLIQVNGLFRHGFLIAPVVLKQVLALVNNQINNTNNNLPYSHYLSTEQRQEEMI